MLCYFILIFTSDREDFVLNMKEHQRWRAGKPRAVKVKGTERHTAEECRWGVHLPYLDLEPLGG